MTSYVQSTLIKDENIIYQGKVSVWSLAPLLIVGLILLPLFGLGLLFWIMAYVRYISTEFAVTNKRVLAKVGFISRHTVEMNLQKVETVQVMQGLLGRIFGFGSLIVTGAGNPQDPVSGIANPMEFRRMVMQAQDQASKAK